MKYLLWGLGALTTISSTTVCASTLSPTNIQPVACITSQFTSTGNQHWKSINLKLTNSCGQVVDFQNSTITFQTTTALNTSFWGDFGPLSYPDNALNISSQAQPGGNYLATLTMHFPTFPSANSKLPAGSSITLKYGDFTDSHIENTVNIYLGTPVNTGSIQLTNSAAKPSNVTQNYALVHLTLNGQPVSDVQLPWSGSKLINGLAADTYGLAAETVTGTDGNTYQGMAVPNTVTVVDNQTVNAIINYSLIPQNGKITINTQALPAELTGYTNNPSVLLTRTQTGASQSQIVTWGNPVTVNQLKDGASYQFSTPPISFNTTTCQPVFTPATVIASETNVPITTLTYQCVQVVQDSVSVNVQGAPSSLTTLNITFTPNNNSTPIEQTIDLVNGSGSALVSLIDGVIYTVSGQSVAGYTLNFSPQPLTATANAIETVTLTANPVSNGRIIGYLPGWKTPPTAQSLVDAGYTHMMVSFGVFSTSTPGQITPAFDTITKAYIQSLHQKGIKVILSLGGALTSLPNTTVDFHQALTAAASPDVFKQTFMVSLLGLMNEYGFDGFDIDIEHGLNGGGTFANPQGDIAVLASIINTMYNQNPNLLITMAPQTANVAATSGFDGVWGNYASLIMQTHNSLAWVGIQLYNTGCMFGIDRVCYGPTPLSNPDFSVAMATDLLENWPAQTPNGGNTGFQPYISYLNPSQVVIGYLAANANGSGDGSPVIPTSTIKRAIQCLKTATASSTSCSTYVPPRAYGNIGGVFNWEVTYDQSNNFRFATDLKNCVMNGVCN
ncbi:glycosyl hydrolase family 18 protein [Legionella waltersii]|uniref:chitinase n=1 Tax=Legionella waltersii TaxID=66969 RepID=A0A0W1AP70_9GAMM|nr:glycosyl hydrolase family 18 protein [Legionella waltersii]KTD83124.1 chitinase [Legionella waltersii]SNU96796.1 chitinase [Legionella waltersii]